MDIAFSESFKKTFSKKIKSSVIEELFWQRVDLFINDPFDPKLKTHKLSGKLKGMWSLLLTIICVWFSFSPLINLKKLFTLI